MNIATGLVVIVLDCILNEVCKSKRQLHLIYLCSYRSEALEYKLHLLLVSNRLKSLHNLLEQVIDINTLDIQRGSRLVHLDQ